MSKAKTIQSRVAYSQVQMDNLKSADLVVQAPALGLKLDDSGRVAVRFLGRELLVSNDGVSAVDGGPVVVDNRSVLAHYLCSRGRAELSGEFVPISRLTGISVAIGSPSENLIKPMVDKIGDRYDLFARAATKIGGRHIGLSQAGAQAWLFDFLPKLPVRVDFFEADEEFPAEIKLLFDSSANQIVSYECLELLTMSMVVALLMAADLISDPEDCEASFI